MINIDQVRQAGDLLKELDEAEKYLAELRKADELAVTLLGARVGISCHRVPIAEIGDQVAAHIERRIRALREKLLDRGFG